LELSNFLKRRGRTQETLGATASITGFPYFRIITAKDSKAEGQKDKIKAMRDLLDELDSVFRNQRSLLTNLGCMKWNYVLLSRSMLLIGLITYFFLKEYSWELWI
jgi:hypothetical protein